MEKQDIETVASLVIGCQLALVTMADYLAKLNVLDRADLANHFDATAAALDADIKNRIMVEMTLRNVAAGLRSQPPKDQDAITALFH